MRNSRRFSRLLVRRFCKRAAASLYWLIVLTLTGRTLSVRVMKDERGRSRGFGFVNFAHHDDAQKVVCVCVFFSLLESCEAWGDFPEAEFLDAALVFLRRSMKWTERSSMGKRFTSVGRRSGLSARGSSSASLSLSNRIGFSAIRSWPHRCHHSGIRARIFCQHRQNLNCSFCVLVPGCESLCEEPGWRHRRWEAAEGVCTLRHHHQCKGSSELLPELLMES